MELLVSLIFHDLPSLHLEEMIFVLVSPIFVFEGQAPEKILLLCRVYAHAKACT